MRRAYLFARGVDVFRRCLVAFFISGGGLFPDVIRCSQLHVGADQIVTYPACEAFYQSSVSTNMEAT